MASQLRFPTPYIEEIPTTQTRQAPGFAWVAVSKSADPKSGPEVTGKKRSRNAGLGQTEAQREALSARQQREIERHIRELNADNARDVNIAIPKKEGGGSGGVRAGKTTSTKKILASGKEFKHYLDDEEAELARTGKVDGLDRDVDVAPAPVPTQRASKTPIARRIPRENSSLGSSPAPAATFAPSHPPLPSESVPPGSDDGAEDEDEFDALPSMPTDEEMRALLDAPPLTYNAARAGPLPPSAPPPRTFCEICGYWGRTKCMKCGARTCSVDCETIHVADRCLKFYA